MKSLEKREEELYEKAFNHGYYTQRYEPELAQKISETPHVHNVYLLTFNDGREARLEEVKEQLKDYRITPENFSKSQDKDRGMDIDR
ncbi:MULTISPECIES: hypothetical protein [Aquimarina]|uniref:Uncharacterized protein n=1 Tax=Aquimarina algiphila TaxID=2047982 RepID=A0A554VIC9_9FLAO|nr:MULTISPECIES: hypothetical protein [Aquimarina]TSE07405.1 hypothetical protein FOF46_15935 [Aquimarina algiphila]